MFEYVGAPNYFDDLKKLRYIKINHLLGKWRTGLFYLRKRFEVNLNTPLGLREFSFGILLHLLLTRRKVTSVRIYPQCLVPLFRPNLPLAHKPWDLNLHPHI
jgi:hypothetical protein